MKRIITAINRAIDSFGIASRSVIVGAMNFLIWIGDTIKQFINWLVARIQQFANFLLRSYLAIESSTVMCILWTLETLIKIRWGIVIVTILFSLLMTGNYYWLLGVLFIFVLLYFFGRDDAAEEEKEMTIWIGKTRDFMYKPTKYSVRFFYFAASIISTGLVAYHLLT